MKRLAFAALTAFVGVLILTLVASTSRIDTRMTVGRHAGLAASNSGICPSGYRSQWHWWYPHWTCEESF